MKIGMIVAMDKELKQLRPLFPEDKVILQKSGIATVNAAIQAVEMIRQYKPDCIISSGCAGGNGDDINLQDVVVSSELTYHDVYCGKAIDEATVYGQVQGLPARYQADPYLLEKAKLTGAKPGLIVTGDWFVDSKDKMREIVGHFPEAKAVSIWSRVLSHRYAISIRYPSSPSVSSATFLCATPMPRSTTTSGKPLPRNLSRPPKHSSKVFKLWKSYRVSPSTTHT